MSEDTSWKEIKHKGGQGNGERDNAVNRIKQYTTDDHHETFTYSVKEPLYRKRDTNSFYFFETLLDEAHPSSKRFYDYLLEAALLHRQKQLDYGKTTDPFSNVRASEDWGVPGWVGAMIRLNDKVRRLQTLSTKGSLVNESVKDSLLDISVYSLIALCLYEQEEQDGKEGSRQ